MSDERYVTDEELTEIAKRGALQAAEDFDQRRAAAAPELRTVRWASDIRDPLPAPVLSLDGRGAWLPVGSVALLSGEGGAAKSALTCSMAVDIAASADVGTAGPFLWHGAASPRVLMAIYEDSAGVVAWRLRKYAEHIKRPDALERVGVLELAGQPLFGPVEVDSGAAFYNSRPGPLAGWHSLSNAVTSTRPALVIVDPALAAYVGESNAAAPVREFVGALAELAKSAECGVLVVAHSTKGARRGKADRWDPGLVGGSAAWTDGVRAVATLTEGQTPEYREVRVPKSNYGPARLIRGVQCVRASTGAVVGFASSGEWHDPDTAASGGDDGKSASAPEHDALAR